jgi:hypothetical protein
MAQIVELCPLLGPIAESGLFGPGPSIILFCSGAVMQNVIPGTFSPGITFEISSFPFNFFN